MGYHFLALSDEDKEARRLMLQHYGFIAQLSAVSLLLLVGLWNWLVTAPSRGANKARRSAASASAALHSDAIELTSQSQHAARERSPTTRAAADGDEAVGLMSGAGRKSEENEVEGRQDEDDAAQGQAAPSSVQDGVQSKPTATAKVGAHNAPSSRWRRLSAFLNAPILPGWRETRRQYLALGVWALWLALLVFRDTGADYFHLAKRLARVPAALLPLHYLLGTPSRLSPLPRLLRAANSGVYNAYHRLHGVLIVGLLLLHGGFYVNYYIQKGLWGRLFTGKVPLLGFGMLTVLGLVLGLARERVRKERRGLFVSSHVLGAGVVLVMLWFHVKHARWYVIEAGVVWAAGVGERGWRWWKARNQRQRQRL